MKRAYIGAGALIFLGLLIYMAPARLLTNYILTEGVQLQHASGTVWSGHADLLVNRHHLGILSWQTDPLSLLKGVVAIDGTLIDDAIHLLGTVELDTHGTRIIVNGEVSPRIFNALLILYEMRIEGNIHLQDVTLEWKSPQHFDRSSGQIRWQGGTVSYRLAQISNSVQLPELTGHLQTQDGDLLMNVTSSNDNKTLLKLRLEPSTGWLHVAGTYALLSLANVSWHLPLSQELYIFEVSEQLFK